MYHYQLRSARALSGDTVQGLIDLGFGVLVDYRIKLFGVRAPSCRSSDSLAVFALTDDVSDMWRLPF